MYFCQTPSFNQHQQSPAQPFQYQQYQPDHSISMTSINQQPQPQPQPSFNDRQLDDLHQTSQQQYPDYRQKQQNSNQNHSKTVNYNPQPQHIQPLHEYNQQTNYQGNTKC
eukprot:TRINITY_DN7604_c0_g1_i2.p1 TRINITY_DN7604_c0_g1~~TRINITY_DN7604_c0_g1_i2.p1  ORF type:complete len:110 (-),score=15.99 TRINITY_DN7604_c0_g1_i2:125-454(-)